MVKQCTSWLGRHKWDKWQHSVGAVEKFPDDDRLWQRRFQTRICYRCGYKEIEWLDCFQIYEPPEQEGE